jgi:hypothetical protein
MGLNGKVVLKVISLQRLGQSINRTGEVKGIDQPDLWRRHGLERM